MTVEPLCLIRRLDKVMQRPVDDNEVFCLLRILQKPQLNEMVLIEEFKNLLNSSILAIDQAKSRASDSGSQEDIRDSDCEKDIHERQRICESVVEDLIDQALELSAEAEIRKVSDNPQR